MHFLQLVDTTHPQQNYLSSKTLGRAVDRMGIAAATLDAYCALVAQQPDIDFSLLGDDTLTSSVEEGVKQAKRVANRYINTIHPEVIASIAELVSIANQFDSMRESLATLIPNLATSPQSRQTFLLLVEQLQERLRKAEIKAQTLWAAQKALQAELSKRAEALAAAIDGIAASAGVDSGKLAELRAQIKDAEGQQAKKTGDVVGSVFEIMGGAIGVEIGVGLLVIGVFAGGAPALAGIPFLIGGITAFVHGIVNGAENVSSLGDNVRKIAAMYGQAAELDTRIAVLDFLANKIVSASDVCAEAATHIGDFAAVWSEIATSAEDFRTLIETTRSTSDVPLIESTLRMATQDWRDLKSRASAVKEKLIAIHPTIARDSKEESGAGAR